MKNSSLAVIIIITLIIAMLASGIIYAFSTSAPQGAEEPKADVTDESNTETDVTDTDAPEEPPETERRIEIINNISVDIPGITEDQDYNGLIKAGAVFEMVGSVQTSGMKVEDIKNVYPGNDLARVVGVWYYGELFGNPLLSSLRAVNKLYPIEFMKQSDDKTLYVVYKTLHWDDIWYTYVFFEKYEERCNETYESWWHKGNVFYVMKALEYSDFAGIHVGSTTADVHDVDPVVTPGPYPDDYPESFASYHLMKDGVLTITYSRDSESNQYLVSAMDYDDSFTFAPYGKDDDYRMNVKVDPNDFPAPSSSDVEVK